MIERRFTEAYQAHSARIYRYCLFRTGSRQEAEDLTAEVFRLLLEARRPPEDSILEPWLLRVARNLCINYQRRQSRHRLRARVLGARHETAAEDPGGGWSDPELLAAVRRLKPREQQIVFLRVFEDLGFGEIGHIVGLKESAAKMAFHRSIKALRDTLEPSAEDRRARAAAAPAALLRIDIEGENCGK
ncbi:MAG: RNA polymerase sigma factor [Thermoleophilia bacterium]|nr:RNA polymerase sigma factor [Thermoleophilia bacterium]